MELAVPEVEEQLSHLQTGREDAAPDAGSLTLSTVMISGSKA